MSHLSALVSQERRDSIALGYSVAVYQTKAASVEGCALARTCSTEGGIYPFTETIICRGIKNVVFGSIDVNPRHEGARC